MRQNNEDACDDAQGLILTTPDKRNEAKEISLPKRPDPINGSASSVAAPCSCS